MDGKIRIILVFLILFFLIFEIILRIFNGYSPEIKYLLFYKYDNPNYDGINDFKKLLKTAPFPRKPGTNIFGFILNSKGFRTKEYQLEKEPGTIRIIALGDSFLSDSGPLPQPYHFMALLENKLKTFINKKFEIINLGLPAIGPQFEKKIFELEGLRLKPDLVIWSFFVGNDFTDDFGIQGKKTWEQNFLIYSYLFRFIRNSYILGTHLLSDGIKKPKVEISKNEKFGSYIGSLADYQPDRPTCNNKNVFLNIQMARLAVLFPKQFPRENWLQLQKTFLAVQYLCRAKKIPLLIIIIPDRNQTDQKLLSEVIIKTGQNIQNLKKDFPQKVLTDFLAANKFKYLDLLVPFQNEGSKKELYFINDGHWNREGHALATKVIFKKIVDLWGRSFNKTGFEYEKLTGERLKL